MGGGGEPRVEPVVWRPEMWALEVHLTEAEATYLYYHNGQRSTELSIKRSIILEPARHFLKQASNLNTSPTQSENKKRVIFFYYFISNTANSHQQRRESAANGTKFSWEMLKVSFIW
jgi:hypothetical protein